MVNDFHNMIILKDMINFNNPPSPNIIIGLGIGGQFKYWGLWIDSEYSNGECSETCTSYKNYIQLAATKSFKIRNIEVSVIHPL